jgi:hypothetical protein
MKDKTIPNFYSILPSVVRYDKKLSWFEKILYSEITALANYKGYCYAYNSYFENVFRISQSTITRAIKNLESRKYISIDLIKSDTNQVLERRIYILGENIYKKNQHTPIVKNDYTPIVKNDSNPIVKNDYDNNIKENNKIFNTKVNKPRNNYLNQRPDVNPDWLEQYLIDNGY